MKKRHLGSLDYAFLVLMATVVAAVAVLVYNALQPEGEKPFSALTYVRPTEIEDEDGVAPQASATALPLPSFDYTPTDPFEVPVKLVRSMACDTSDCPEGAIPLFVDIQWVRVDATGSDQAVYPIESDTDIQMLEGRDYIGGQLEITRVGLPPFPVPPEVEADIQENNREFSAWRIEGVTTADVKGAVPAPWNTVIFHVYAPEEAE